MYLPGQLVLPTATSENEIIGITDKTLVALGIQGKPGTEFWINESQNQDNSFNVPAITIGKTGIYELDLTNGFGLISSVHVKTNNQPIIIDYLYIDENKGGVGL